MSHMGFESIHLRLIPSEILNIFEDVPIETQCRADVEVMGRIEGKRSARRASQVRDREGWRRWRCARSAAIRVRHAQNGNLSCQK